MRNTGTFRRDVPVRRGAALLRTPLPHRGNLRSAHSRRNTFAAPPSFPFMQKSLLRSFFRTRDFYCHSLLRQEVLPDLFGALRLREPAKVCRIRDGSVGPTIVAVTMPHAELSVYAQDFLKYMEENARTPLR